MAPGPAKAAPIDQKTCAFVVNPSYSDKTTFHINTNNVAFFNILKAFKDKTPQGPYKRRIRKKLNNNERFLVAAPQSYVSTCYWPSLKHFISNPFSHLYFVTRTTALRGPPAKNIV